MIASVNQDSFNGEWRNPSDLTQKAVLQGFHSFKKVLTDNGTEHWKAAVTLCLPMIPVMYCCITNLSSLKQLVIYYAHESATCTGFGREGKAHLCSIWYQPEALRWLQQVGAVSWGISWGWGLQVSMWVSPRDYAVWELDSKDKHWRESREDAAVLPFMSWPQISDSSSVSSLSGGSHKGLSIF